MKKILYLLVLMPFLLKAQTTGQNFIKIITYRDSTTNSATTARTDVTYFDGLGRPSEKIQGKMSASGTDVVTHIEYDAFGRPAKEYLPYPSQTSALEYNGLLQSTLDYYADPTKVQDTAVNPYTERFYENSPLSRVVKQGAPGAIWKGHTGNNDNDHTIKFSFHTNIADEVKKISANADTANDYNPSFVNIGTNYPIGELYKTVTKDENWTSGTANTTEEFKNKDGQVVLKRTYDGTTAHETYYVYDQFGNLTYVLPPLMNGSNTNMDNLGYQYKYDNRNRQIEKKLPGKQWEFTVFNPLDKPVLSGPALTPWGGSTSTVADVGWIMTIYDVFGRVAMTGWYSATATSAARKSTQTTTTTVVAAVRGSGTIGGISGVGYNSIAGLPAGFKLLTVNYYDDYTWPGAPTLPSTVEGQKIRSKAKGLLTGSWTRVLDAVANTTAAVSYTLYDNKGRTITTKTTNYLGGYTQIDNKLDFDGSLIYTITKHKRVNADTEISVREDFTYSAQDRLLTHTHKIGNLTAQTLTNNIYNALGQLITKKVGNGTLLPGYQTVDYKYNIRGWLTDINNIDNLGSDLFAFKIAYNNVTDPITGYVPLYNGNISETYWRTSSDNTKRKYSYQYDNLNRLKYSYYQKPGATPSLTGSYNENIRYDKNGNITGLSRNGAVDDPNVPVLIDDLTYTYGTNSNQLTKVVDGSNSPQGFKDVNSSNNTEYTYDANGNMITDLNKGITGIKYNYLNLPTEISFGSTNKIVYLYDAAGQKLKKTVTEVVSGTTTTVYVDYLDGFQYKGGVLQFFPTAEGYVDNTVSGSSNVYNYVFQYKDHLGNVRVSYSNSTDKNGVNATRIKEENHYYPFGLKHLNYNMDYLEYQEIEGDIVMYPPLSATGKLMNNYKFLGQERQDELGLNWDTFRYRNYDPAIGRFMGVDPISEQFFSQTNYQFAHNSPVWKIELEGLEGATSNNTTDVPNHEFVKVRGTGIGTIATRDAPQLNGALKTAGIGQQARNQIIEAYSDGKVLNPQQTKTTIRFEPTSTMTQDGGTTTVTTKQTTVSIEVGVDGGAKSSTNVTLSVNNNDSSSKSSTLTANAGLSGTVKVSDDVSATATVSASQANMTGTSSATGSAVSGAPGAAESGPLMFKIDVTTTTTTTKIIQHYGGISPSSLAPVSSSESKTTTTTTSRTAYSQSNSNSKIQVFKPL